MNFNSDYSASAAAGDYRTIKILKTDLPNLDEQGVRGFTIASG